MLPNAKQLERLFAWGALLASLATVATLTLG